MEELLETQRAIFPAVTGHRAPHGEAYKALTDYLIGQPQTQVLGTACAAFETLRLRICTQTPALKARKGAESVRVLRASTEA